MSTSRLLRGQLPHELRRRLGPHQQQRGAPHRGPGQPRHPPYIAWSNMASMSGAEQGCGRCGVSRSGWWWNPGTWWSWGGGTWPGVHIREATEPHAPFVRVKAAARGEVLPPGQLVDVDICWRSRGQYIGFTFTSLRRDHRHSKQS